MGVINKNCFIIRDEFHCPNKYFLFSNDGLDTNTSYTCTGINEENGNMVKCVIVYEVGRELFKDVLRLNTRSVISLQFVWYLNHGLSYKNFDDVDGYGLVYKTYNQVFFHEK